MGKSIEAKVVVPCLFSLPRSYYIVSMAPTPKAPAAHPPYETMIKAAITALKDRKGSSGVAIAKYLGTNYSLPDTFKKRMSLQMKRLVESGKLKKAPKKKVVKKKTPAKPKTAVKKKVAPKKKATTVKKTTTKKKTPAKKAPAKKVAKKKTPAKKKATKKYVSADS